MIIRTPAELPSLDRDDRDELLIRHPRVWSAVSVTLPSTTLVVINPTHDPPRISYSLCHELSYLILAHAHGRMVTFDECVMREFDNRQEEGANWLGGSLLVPEAALKRAKFGVFREWGTDLPPPEPLEEAGARRHRLYRALSELVDRLVDLVVVEDAHWADPASLEWLLVGWESWGDPRSVVVTYRRGMCPPMPCSGSSPRGGPPGWARCGSFSTRWM